MKGARHIQAFGFRENHQDDSLLNILLVYDFADRKGAQSKTGWTVSLIVLAGLSIVGLGGYILYKYRLRVCFTTIFLFFLSSSWNESLINYSMMILNSTILHRCLFYMLAWNAMVQSYMDSEIRAIMAQYMPLDSQGEVQNHSHDDI